MSLLKIDENFTKTYNLCKEYNIPPIFIKEYKGNITNLIKFVKPRIDDISFLQKFLESYKYKTENKLLFLYILYKDTYDIKTMQNLFVEFFNYCNQKKLNVIEKYIIDLKDNIESLDYKIEKSISNHIKFYNQLENYYTSFNNIGIDEKNIEMKYNNVKIESDYTLLFNTEKLNKKNIKILFNYINITEYIKVIIFNDMFKLDNNYNFDLEEREYKKDTIHIYIEERGILSYCYIDMIDSKIVFNKKEVKNIKAIFETEELKDLISVNETFGTTFEGYFYMYIKNYDEFYFYMMTLFDDVVNNFIYLQEKNFPRSFIKNIIYKIRKSVNEENIGSFTISNYLENYYIVNYYDVKSDNLKFIYDILSVVTNYMNKDNIGSIYYGEQTFTYNEIFNFINEELNVETNVKQKFFSKKKIDFLKSSNINFNNHKYVRDCDCKHQPIFVHAEDINNWSTIRNILTMSEKNYVCPTNEFPSIYLKNKLPCCSKSKSKETTIYIKNVPQDIKNIIDMEDKKLKMYFKGGIETEIDSNSNLIYCIFSAFSKNTKNYDNFHKNEDKENYIKKFRKKLENFINLEIVYQECYNLNNFKEIIKDHKKVFDSKYFYKCLEVLFNVNIFVFIKTDNGYILEKPNCFNFHCREIIDIYPCVFIYKEESSYYLIKDEKIGVFDRSQRMKDYINSFGYYTLDKNLIKRKNPNSKVNWNYILKDHEILSQRISSAGRTFCIHIKHIYKTIEYEIPIFIPETFPLNLPETKVKVIQNIPDYIVVSLMGIPKERSIDGHYYKIGDLGNKIFVPCKTNSISEKKFLPYIVESHQRTNQNDFIEFSNNIENNSKILLKILLYLKSLEKNKSLQEWVKSYLNVKNLSSELNLKKFKNIRIIIIPKNIKSTRTCISWLNNYQPSIFYNDKINLELEFYISVVNYLYNTKEIPSNIIFKEYNYSFDYQKKDKNTKIITNLESISSINTSYEKIEVIKDMINMEEFLYSHDDNLWLFKKGTQSEAINYGLNWKNYKDTDVAIIYYHVENEVLVQKLATDTGTVSKYIEVYENPKMCSFYAMLPLS